LIDGDPDLVQDAITSRGIGTKLNWAGHVSARFAIAFAFASSWTGRNPLLSARFRKLQDMSVQTRSDVKKGSRVK
jgi:hypothetical protein